MSAVTSSGQTPSCKNPSTCTLIVTTYNRADLLARLLEHGKELLLPPGWTIDCLIIDNHPDRHAEAVVAALPADYPIPVRYISELRPGVSHARNRGIAESQSAYLVFVDDDEWLDANWLLNVLGVVEAHDADVVGGRILLWWEAVEKPEWFNLQHAGLLSQKDYGEEFKQVFTRGAITAPFCVKAELFQRNGVFRVDLGRSAGSCLAGEETDWHQRALGQGARYYYCGKALTHHWVAPNRITPEYLCSVSYGGGYSVILLGDDTRLVLVARCLWWGVAWALNSFSAWVSRVFSKGVPSPFWRNRKIRVARIRGKMAGAFSLLWPNSQKQSDQG